MQKQEADGSSVERCGFQSVSLIALCFSGGISRTGFHKYSFSAINVGLLCVLRIPWLKCLAVILGTQETWWMKEMENLI